MSVSPWSQYSKGKAKYNNSKNRNYRRALKIAGYGKTDYFNPPIHSEVKETKQDHLELNDEDAFWLVDNIDC